MDDAAPDDVAYEAMDFQSGDADDKRSRTTEDYAVGTVDVDDVTDEDSGYDPSNPHHVGFSWRLLWLYTGPGWLMSMAYLDPGNLTSDLQQGAYTQYQLLWVLWWSTVAGWILQVLSARIGVVTGKDLAQVCREEMPRWAVINLFIQMELAIIGADIQEVLGSAIALKILFGVPLWGGCLITAISTFSMLAIQKYGVRLLEAFFAAFIGIMAVCFMVNWGEAHTASGPFMKGWVVPEISGSALLQAVGIVGAVIMPHNLYLHSGLVLSRKVDRKNVHKVAVGNYYNSLESGMALFASYFINAAIVATFAAKFYDATCANGGPKNDPAGPFGCVSDLSINRASCDGSELPCPHAIENKYGPCNFPDSGGVGQCAQIGLLLAGDALEGSMGSAAKYVWGIGLLAAGQAATMTATYAGQFVFAGFIQLDLPMWSVMMITRGFALGPSVVIALIAGNNPGVSATMNEWLNTLQSIQLPFALLPAMMLANNKRIMGEFCTPFKWQIICWTLAVLLLAVNTYFMVTFLADPGSPVPRTKSFSAFVAIYGLAYYGFIVYMVRDELMNFFYYVTGQNKHQDTSLGALRQGNKPINDAKFGATLA